MKLVKSSLVFGFDLPENILVLRTCFDNFGKCCLVNPHSLLVVTTENLGYIGVNLVGQLGSENSLVLRVKGLNHNPGDVCSPLKLRTLL
jgi:hypothetical protein